MSDPRRNEPTFNPYAAPHAHVADASGDSGGTQPVRLFSARGRMGRLRYICWSSIYNLTATLLALIVLTVLVLTTMGPSFFTTLYQKGFIQAFKGINPAVIAIGVALMALIMIGGFVLTLLLTIQRSHDMGWPGWSILIMIAVIIGIMIVAAVLSAISPVLTVIVSFLAVLVPFIWYVKPGTPGVNPFGAPPDPTPLVVQIFAWIFVAGMAIRFLANLVSIAHRISGNF